GCQLTILTAQVIDFIRKPLNAGSQFRIVAAAVVSSRGRSWWRRRTVVIAGVTVWGSVIRKSPRTYKRPTGKSKPKERTAKEEAAIKEERIEAAKASVEKAGMDEDVVVGEKEPVMKMHNAKRVVAAERHKRP